MEPPNQSKSGVARGAAKRPLQDITARYNPTRSSVNCPTPNLTPKPNPFRKTPGQIVSASLPPSSPPSASSRSLAAHAQLVSPFVPSLESDGRLDTTAASEANSDADPFGFFALENKLKIFRSRQQRANPRDQPAPSPQIQAVYSDFVNPPTPSKRRHEHKDIKSPSSFSKDDDSEPAESMLSTPLKAVSKKGKERAVAEEGSIPRVALAMKTSETPVPSHKTKLRRRNAKGIADVPSRKSPLRKIGATARTRKNVSHRRTREEDGVHAEPPMNTRQKPRVKKTANPASGVNTDDAKERQARLDYFKKLEDYQLEKENVYVV